MAREEEPRRQGGVHYLWLRGARERAQGAGPHTQKQMRGGRQRERQRDNYPGRFPR